MSSPPPPPSKAPSFEKRVGFDLRAGEYGELPSFGRSFAYEGYTPRGRARVYLCGTDTSDYATYALEHTIKHFMDDGDKLICVRAVEKDSPNGKRILADHQKYVDIVEVLLLQLKKVLKDNGGPAISVKIDTVVGSVGRLLIEDMVQLHDPMCIVIGTKGEGGAKKQLGVKRSISEYLYKYSPVPLIIVRLPQKRMAYFQERQEDRTRERYKTPLGDTMVDSQGRVTPTPAPEASPEESRKVREAMNVTDVNFTWMRQMLENKVSKRQSARVAPEDYEEQQSNASEEFEDILSEPPSRPSSPDGQATEQSRTVDGGQAEGRHETARRGSLDTIEDDEFGESLTKVTSSGGVLQSGWGVQEPRKQFHEMPNYDERVVKIMDKLERGQDENGNGMGNHGRKPSIKWKDMEMAKSKENTSSEAEEKKMADNSINTEELVDPIPHDPKDHEKLTAGNAEDVNVATPMESLDLSEQVPAQVDEPASFANKDQVDDKGINESKENESAKAHGSETSG